MGHWLVENLGRLGWVIWSAGEIHSAAGALCVLEKPIMEAIILCLIGSDVAMSLVFWLPREVFWIARVASWLKRFLINCVRRLFGREPIKKTAMVKWGNSNNRLVRRWQEFRHSFTEYIVKKRHGELWLYLLGANPLIPGSMKIAIVAQWAMEIPRWRCYTILLVLNTARSWLLVWYMYKGVSWIFF